MYIELQFLVDKQKVHETRFHSLLNEKYGSYYFTITIYLKLKQKILFFRSIFLQAGLPNTHLITTREHRRHTS